jgi:hypothetical protein
VEFKFTLRNLLFGLIGVSLLMILGVNAYRHGPSSDIPFDADQWNGARGPERDQLRYRMLTDLKRNHLSIGMPESEVIQLLGDPGGYPTDDWRYWRLYDRNNPTGQITIAISFDDQRRVRHFYDSQMR